MNPPRESGSVPSSGAVPIAGRGRVPQFDLMEPSSAAGWDDLVTSHPEYSFFHGAAWARVLQSSYGHAPFYLGAAEGGSLLALAPMMEVTSRVTARRGVSLPFTDECGLLTSDFPSAKALIRDVFELGRRRRWRYVEFRGAREGLFGAPPSVSFCGHALDLSPSKSRIFAGFESSVRRAIRRAERSGVAGEIWGSLRALRDYYKLHCQTRKRHGLPPQPFSFFRRIPDYVLAQGRGCVVFGRYRGQPDAGGVFFHLGEKAVYKYGASDHRLQHVRGSNLVFWEAIRWFCDRGIRSLHFGRSSMVQEGLRRFKLGFGTREHRIDYYRYDLREGRFSQGRDAAFGWYNRLFGP